MCFLLEHYLVILLKIDCDISIIMLSPNAVIAFVMLRDVNFFNPSLYNSLYLLSSEIECFLKL